MTIRIGKGRETQFISTVFRNGITFLFDMFNNGGFISEYTPCNMVVINY